MQLPLFLTDNVSEPVCNDLFVFSKRVVRATRKLNPLTNTKAMLRLNPYSAVLRRKAVLDQERRNNERALALAEKRGVSENLRIYVYYTYILVVCLINVEVV